MIQFNLRAAAIILYSHPVSTNFYKRYIFSQMCVFDVLYDFWLTSASATQITKLMDFFNNFTVDSEAIQYQDYNCVQSKQSQKCECVWKVKCFVNNSIKAAINFCHSERPTFCVFLSAWWFCLLPIFPYFHVSVDNGDVDTSCLSHAFSFWK